MAFEQEEPKNFLIATIGIGSMVVLGVVMFALQSYYYSMRDAEQHVKVLGVVDPSNTALKEKETKTLTSYALLDKSGTRVRIPIEEAKKLLAQKGRDAFPQIKPETQEAPAASALPAGSGSPTPAASVSAIPATSGSNSPPNPPGSSSAPAAASGRH